MSFPSALTTAEQDTSTISNDPLPENISLPLTPQSPSLGSGISQVFITQIVPATDLLGGLPTALEPELVTLSSESIVTSDESNMVLAGSADFPACSEFNISTPSNRETN